MEEKKYTEDCIHVEYDADGPQCKINACKGFQCRHRLGEDCGCYESKAKKKQSKTKAGGQEYIKKDNITVDINNNPHQGGSIGTTTDGKGTPITVNPTMSYGWVCPKCGRVNAPWKSTCDCYKGISLPYTPPNTPQTTPGELTPYYNPPLEIPNPFDPYGPYKWGDAPGWWRKGPTCKDGQKFVWGIEYPDGHIEKVMPGFISSDPIPCSPTAGDPNFGKPESLSNKISSQPGGDPNISAWNK